MTGTLPIIEREPTESFELACSSAFSAWQAGDVPFNDTAGRLRQLRQEAVKVFHVANEARAEFFLGVMHGYRTNLNLAAQHFRRARELYDRVGNVQQIVSCDVNLGEIARQRGDFSQARRLFDEAYQYAKELENLGVMTVSLVNKGQALRSLGQLDAAHEAIQEGLLLYNKWSPEPVRTDLLTEANYGLAVIRLEQGHLADAWEAAKKTYALAHEDEQPMQVGFANRAMAEILTALGQIPEEDQADFPLDIDSYFQAALAAFRDIDAEGEIARTTFAQAKSLSMRGRRVHAARRIQQAMIAFAQLGMIDDAAQAAKLQTQIF